MNRRAFFLVLPLAPAALKAATAPTPSMRFPLVQGYARALKAQWYDGHLTLAEDYDGDYDHTLDALSYYNATLHSWPLGKADATMLRKLAELSRR